MFKTIAISADSGTQMNRPPTVLSHCLVDDDVMSEVTLPVFDQTLLQMADVARILMRYSAFTLATCCSTSSVTSCWTCCWTCICHVFQRNRSH